MSRKAGQAPIAHLCQRAENEFVGAPTGDLDQVAVTQCPAESALVYNAAEGTAQTISLAPILRKCEILVINTGVAHQLARGEYANRRSECESAARSLGVTHLSDLEQGTGLEALEIPHLIARTRHVVTENARVLRAVAACARGDEVELGGLMTESHASLRDDFNVSWPELDAAVETALQLDALGARMTGGGFGGSAIALVSREHSNAVIQSLPSLVVRRGFHPPEVFAVAPTGPAHIVATQAEGSR